MKKSILVASLIIMATMFIRCTKEKESTPLNSVTSNALSDAQVEAKIKVFNEKLNNASKSETPMSVNDAVWNIEAALNYNFCLIDLPQGQTTEDSLFVEFPLENGTLAFADIISAYQQSVEVLQLLQKKENAHAIVMDVIPLQTTGLFKAKVTFLVGDGVNKKNVICPNSFGTTDYWRWSWGLGKCDGTFTPDDARSQLAYWLNSSVLPYIHAYFTDIAEVTAQVDPYSNTFINTNDQTANDNYIDYKIFINRRQGLNGNGNLINLPNFVDEYYPGPCITPDEMNFYKWSIKDIAENYTSNGGIRPSNKSIVNYSITSLVLLYNINNAMVIYYTSHKIHVNYGILHSNIQN